MLLQLSSSVSSASLAHFGLGLARVLSDVGPLTRSSSLRLHPYWACIVQTSLIDGVVERCSKHCTGGAVAELRVDMCAGLMRSSGVSPGCTWLCNTVSVLTSSAAAPDKPARPLCVGVADVRQSIVHALPAPQASHYTVRALLCALLTAAVDVNVSSDCHSDFSFESCVSLLQLC